MRARVFCRPKCLLVAVLWLRVALLCLGVALLWLLVAGLWRGVAGTRDLEEGEYKL